MTAFNLHFLRQHLKENKILITIIIFLAILAPILTQAFFLSITIWSVLVLYIYIQTLVAFVQHLHLEAETIEGDLIEDDKNNNEKIKFLLESVRTISAQAIILEDAFIKLHARYYKLEKNVNTISENIRTLSNSRRNSAGAPSVE